MVHMTSLATFQQEASVTLDYIATRVVCATSRGILTHLLDPNTA